MRSRMPMMSPEATNAVEQAQQVAMMVHMLAERIYSENVVSHAEQGLKVLGQESAAQLASTAFALAETFYAVAANRGKPAPKPESLITVVGPLNGGGRG